MGTKFLIGMEFSLIIIIINYVALVNRLLFERSLDTRSICKMYKVLCTYYKATAGETVMHNPKVLLTFKVVLI